MQSNMVLDQRIRANDKTIFYNDKCDKYDYLIAAGCGAIAGLIDIFLVGSPTDSKMQSWTDAQVDKTVMSFAKRCGWSPRSGNENNIASAIGYLEHGKNNGNPADFQGFKVNYDQRHSGDVGNLFNMSAKNHHMKSLGHSPDIVGLFFSILNQFTSTSSFLHNGQLITIDTQTFELKGNDFVSKVICGFTNWIGHIMSDVAGSSGATGRGSGVVIPFYELFQLCDFGNFKVGDNRNTLATLATKVFQEGYDARFGLTMSIPVVVCDLSIRLIWAIKHYFYHKYPLSECIPNKRHDDLRMMLLVGDGVLCLMDGADAYIRSGGEPMAFFMRLNLIAWFRLITLALREVCIRLNISFSLQKELNAYIVVNQALTQYLKELERIDINRFREETKKYNDLVYALENTKSEKELNSILKRELRNLGIKVPEMDFANKNGTLVIG